MAEAAELLSQLRDIHMPALPAEPSVWPAFAAAALLTFAVIAALYLWRRRKHRWAIESKKQIALLQQQTATNAVQGYARLLRKIVLTFDHDKHTRTLHGDSWLLHLDGFFNTRFFSEQAGRVFGDSLYQDAAVGLVVQDQGEQGQDAQHIKTRNHDEQDKHVQSPDAHQLGKALNKLITRRLRRTW